jgi:hypothetical protein
MMQMIRMILIALLAGLFAGGLVWFSVDASKKAVELFRKWREKRKRKAEADELLEQADEPRRRPE